eukprot:666284_1
MRCVDLVMNTFLFCIFPNAMTLLIFGSLYDKVGAVLVMCCFFIVMVRGVVNHCIRSEWPVMWKDWCVACQRLRMIGSRCDCSTASSCACAVRWCDLAHSLLCVLIR